MIDLEVEGKLERQRGRNAFISSHTHNDAIEISHCRDPDSDLIVRINPFSQKTRSELNSLVQLNISYVMLPMIQSLEQVSQVVNIMKELHVPFKLLPLIEHIDGFNALASILDKHRHIKKVFFGLNDLSLSLNLPFVFQCIAENYIERGAQVCKEKGVDFGFGGVGMMDSEDVVAPELIVSEHARIGSSSTILSRSFRDKFNFLKSKDGAPSPAEAKSLKDEVGKLKHHYEHCATLSAGELLAKREKLDRAIHLVSH